VGFNRFAQTVSAGNFSYPNLDSFPNLVLNDLNTLQIGPDGKHRKGQTRITYSAAEAITWTKSAHTLKFGFEGRKLIAPQTFTQRSRGDYEYVHALSFFQVRPRTFSQSAATATRILWGPGSALLVRENETGGFVKT